MTVIENLMMNTSISLKEGMKRGRGRPRKHASNATKQAAYRRRKQYEEREKLVVRVLDRTPIPEGRYAEIARELRTLTIRKLKERLWKLDPVDPEIS
jgi:AT hook motif